MSKAKDALDLEVELEKSLTKGHEMAVIRRIVTAHSLWVPPEVHRKVAVVYPLTRRKTRAEQRWAMDGDVKLCDNQPASKAFWWGLGMRRKNVTRFNVCHLYGREEGGLNRHHFTNLANLIAVPVSLESMTEWGPVNCMLRRRSFELYDYTGPKNVEPERIPLDGLPWRKIHREKPVSEIIADLKEQRRKLPTYTTMSA